MLASMSSSSSSARLTIDTAWSGEMVAEEGTEKGEGGLDVVEEMQAGGFNAVPAGGVVVGVVVLPGVIVAASSLLSSDPAGGKAGPKGARARLLFIPCLTNMLWCEVREGVPAMDEGGARREVGNPPSVIEGRRA